MADTTATTTTKKQTRDAWTQCRAIHKATKAAADAAVEEYYMAMQSNPDRPAYHFANKNHLAQTLQKMVQDQASELGMYARANGVPL